METNDIHEDVGGGVTLKMWTRGVPVEAAARRRPTKDCLQPFGFGQRMSAGADT